MSLETRKYFAPDNGDKESAGSSLESVEGLKLKIKDFDTVRQFGFLDDGTLKGLFFHASNVKVSRYTMKKNAPVEIKNNTELYRIETGYNDKGTCLVSGMTAKAFEDYKEELKREEEEKAKELEEQKKYDLEAEKLKGCRVESSINESKSESGPFSYVSTLLVFPDGSTKPVATYRHIITEEMAKKYPFIRDLQQEIADKENKINNERDIMEERKELELVPTFFDETTWNIKKDKSGAILLYSGDYLIFVIQNSSTYNAPQLFLDTHYNSKYTDKVKKLFSSLGGESTIREGIDKYKKEEIIPGKDYVEETPIYESSGESGDQMRRAVTVIVGYRNLHFHKIKVTYTLNGNEISFEGSKRFDNEKKQNEDRVIEENEANEKKKAPIIIEKYEEGRVYFSNGKNISIGEWPEIMDCIGGTITDFKNNIATTSTGYSFDVPPKEKNEISVGVKITKYEYGLLRFNNGRAARIGLWPDALDLVGQKVIKVKDRIITTSDGSTIHIPTYYGSDEFPEFELSQEEIENKEKEYAGVVEGNNNQQKREPGESEKNIFTREMLYKDTSIRFLRTVVSSLHTPDNVRNEAALLILNQNPEKGDVYEILEQTKDENIIKESCKYLKEKFEFKKKDIQKFSERFGSEVAKFLE